MAFISVKLLRVNKNIIFSDSGYCEKMDYAFGQVGFDNFPDGCCVSRQIRFGNSMKFPFTLISLQSPKLAGQLPGFS